MPRTTLDIDRTVLDELKRRSRRERKTAGQLASELLAQALESPEQAQREPLRWISQNMGPPKVDLEDKDALWAMLTEEDYRRGSGE
ncbi:MAG TPA: hypothetical protein VFI37_05780 [Gaiellaceae bacterium]|nr:hypothetical protein [Gaiellaceae bacterium]